MATDYIRVGNRAIKQNIWDNWYGYENNRRTMAFGNSKEQTAEDAAHDWLQRRKDAEGTIVPTVHLNGTSASELEAHYNAALGSTTEAIRALTIAYPNVRDYYPIGDDAFQLAMGQHAARLRKLTDIRDELRLIVETLQADVEERRLIVESLHRNNARREDARRWQRT